jgi:hypothetical protein
MGNLDADMAAMAAAHALPAALLPACVESLDRLRGKPRRSGPDVIAKNVLRQPLHGGVKSADGEAVLAFDFSAESAAVRCTAG